MQNQLWLQSAADESQLQINKASTEISQELVSSLRYFVIIQLQIFITECLHNWFRYLILLPLCLSKNVERVSPLNSPMLIFKPALTRINTIWKRNDSKTETFKPQKP